MADILEINCATGEQKVRKMTKEELAAITVPSDDNN